MIRFKDILKAIVLLLTPAAMWAQDNTQLKEVQITRERSLMVPQGIYEGYNAVPPHIGNVFQLDIFQDQITQEVWYTETPCLVVEQQTDINPGNESGMKLQWNKMRSDCAVDWIGLGIGWDGWAAKDLIGIVDSAAIRLRVRSEKGTINSLPLAMALEDYSGKQAWIGMTSDRFEDGPIGEEWTDVLLPLNAFGWNLMNANLSNMKQLIIQFEADGTLLIDKIDLVRKPIPPRHHTQLSLTNDSLVLDGAADKSILGKPSFEFNGAIPAWLYANNSHFGLYLDIPRTDTLGELKKIDLFISSNPDASPRREARLMSDHWFTNTIGAAVRSESLGVELKKGGTQSRQQKDVQNIEWIIDMSEAHFSGFANGQELLFDARLTFERNGEEYVLMWNNQNPEVLEQPRFWGFVDVNSAQK